MKTLYVATAILSLGLAACSYNKDDYNNEASYNAEGAAYNESGANYSEGSNYSDKTSNYSAAGGNWPAGTRIVVENGTTYRIGPDGARVALGPNDSRIVVENGVRYRVDPGGARVRIDENGVAVDVAPPNVTVNTTTNGQ